MPKIRAPKSLVRRVKGEYFINVKLNPRRTPAQLANQRRFAEAARHCRVRSARSFQDCVRVKLVKTRDKPRFNPKKCQYRRHDRGAIDVICRHPTTGCHNSRDCDLDCCACHRKHKACAMMKENRQKTKKACRSRLRKPLDPAKIAEAFDKYKPEDPRLV